MLVVHPSIPVNSVAEFVAYAKKQPVPYAHGGNGSPGHLTMEYFRLQAGFQAVPVPYRGNAPLVTDLVAGQIKFGFVGGRCAPTCPSRAAQSACDIERNALSAHTGYPYAGETGYPDFKVDVYYVMMAPAGIPELSRSCWSARSSRRWRRLTCERNFVPRAELVATTGAETVARIKDDRALWAEVVKAADLRVD